MWKSKFSEQQVINGGSLRLLGLRKLAAGVSGLGACGKEKSKSKLAFLPKFIAMLTCFLILKR